MPFGTSYTWSGDAAWLRPDYIRTTATNSSSVNLKNLQELLTLFGNAYLAYSEGIPVNDDPGYCKPLEPKEPEEELNFDDILEQWK